MKSLYAFLALLLFQLMSFAQAGSSKDRLLTKILTREQMREDFGFLRRVLEETHPGLYRYTSKQAMTERADSIAASFSRPMPFYDFYRLLASFISDVRCAHTFIIPKQDLGKYMGEIKGFPFEAIILNDQLFLTLNGTDDSTIMKPGYEVLSINGQTAHSVLKNLYQHTWADGYIESSKRQMIGGNGFAVFYYAMIERPDSFRLELKDLQGKTIRFTVPALAPAVVQANYFKNPVNQSLIALHSERNKKDRENGWRLEFTDNPTTALLRIKGFGGGKDSEEAAQIMRSFMEKNIDTLKKRNISNLIIDLRNNGGGWDIQGVELFTYLMKDTTPVRYYARKHSITDSTEFLRFSDLSEEDKANVKKELIREKDGTFTIKEEYNPDLKLQYAKPSRFIGNVYFLVNGGSASTTSEFAAVAHSHKLGLFIGEETGGAYEGGNGGSFLHFQLPNSGISIGTPLLFYNNGVKPPKQKGRGAIPDHAVQVTIADILKGRDAAMELTMKLIGTK